MIRDFKRLRAPAIGCVLVMGLMSTAWADDAGIHPFLLSGSDPAAASPDAAPAEAPRPAPMRHQARPTKSQHYASGLPRAKMARQHDISREALRRMNAHDKAKKDSSSS